MPLSPTTARPPTSSRSRVQSGPSSRFRGPEQGLLLIGLFKLSKTVGCIIIGAACLHLIHRNVGNEAMHLVDWLGLDPEGRIAGALLDKADLINPHDLRVTGALSFVGAAIYAVEGIGLMLRKVWAEYFTVIFTTMGLPWEIYEMIHRYTHWKLGLFFLNLLVVAYLAWMLRHKLEKEEAT